MQQVSGSPQNAKAYERSAPAGFLSWWSRARTSLSWMFVIAFALRLVYILVAHTYRVKPNDDYFSFGYEMGRIGRAVASGRGFADPFGPHTGPTAWEPPIYPYLIAAAFKLTGVYTHGSAFILLSINSIFSALTCIPIFLIAKKCFSEKVAVWSAWAWALLPTVMYWSTRWVWETSLAALLMALIFWLVIEMEALRGAIPWVGFGLLWGVAALTNSSLLAFLPASGLWLWYRRAKRGKNSIGGVLMASLFFAAAISPWLVRNYEVFGRFVFVRSNFGAELRLGNGPGADGTWMSYLHPTQNELALKQYEQMREIAYVAERKREAIQFIRADYGRFAWISVKRFVYYWAGRPRTSESATLIDNSAFLASSVLAFWGLALALRKRRPGAWLFFWLLICYPTIYYFVYPHARYRHPIEPEMAILIAYVISEAQPRKTSDVPNKAA
ncbi:MAG TPA: glycosyltransferase family 39 protein [Terriglobales bacterium]|nr:glycosyltransferase family 39 protein [Terriglobales bacterium]